MDHASEFSVVTTSSEIHRMLPVWRELQAPGMARLFCGPTWSMASWQYLPGTGKPYLLVHQESDTLTLLPMSIVEDEGHQRIVFAGGPLIDVGDALSSAADPVERTCQLLKGVRQILDPGDWIDLRPVYPYSLIAQALQRGKIKGYAIRVESAGTSPLIRLRGIERLRLTRKFRGQLVRSRGKLSELGDLQWHRIVPTPSNVQDFLARRRQQWEVRGRLAELPWPQHGPSFVDFMVAIASDHCFIDELRIATEVVSQDLYLDSGQSRLQYMRHFNPKYAKYVPGHLLVLESLQGDRQAGIETLDFGRGDEEWKYSFGAADQPLLWFALMAE